MNPKLSVILVARTPDADLSPSRARLAVQTAGAGAFEVLEARPERSADVAAAWNRAARQARGSILLLLDPAERPAPDLIERHLAAHEGVVSVIQGLSLEVACARTIPVDIAGSGLPIGEGQVFPRVLASLRHRQACGWRAFTGSNLSLSVAVFRAIGGFDETAFADGVGAALDLGYRLEAAGSQLHFAEDAVSAPPARTDLDTWLAAHRDEGVALARIACKHEDPGVLWFAAAHPADDELLLHHVQHRLEATLPAQQRVLEPMRRIDFALLSPGERARLAPHLEAAGALEVYRGFLIERTGGDPVPTILGGPLAGELVSVVVLSYDALAMTRRCLDHLRRFREPAHPIQIVVVDNGSTDGSREWLETQADVTLIANRENLGAPIARNQAVAQAAGAWLVFMDNDAMVGPGWLSRLLYHAQADARAGFVGPVSDRAAHGQSIAGVPAEDALVPEFAEQIAGSCRRQYKVNVLLSSFCVLVSRRVLERIGGFDPRFSPWGFEDDDITLRAHLAGYHNRVALDVFVQHLPYAGTKLARHEDLLRRNWQRFAGKWGLGADTPYGGGVEHLHRVGARAWSDAELNVRFDAPAPSDAEALRPAARGRGKPRRVSRKEPGALAPAPVAADPAPLCAAPDLAPAPPRLELSVIVPTYNRPDLVAKLLDHLDRQTLDPAAFEVILVDDGSPEPVRIDRSRHRFAIELLRQDNAGPGAARNLALGRCRAPLTLIFNDDAVPAPDDLAEHLRAHRERPGPHAVLGTFDFVDGLKDDPFIRLLEGTSLLFNYAAMRHGQTYSWEFFWTCNLSLATETLRRAGGFDVENFREAIVEDVELGYRLARTGVRVRFWERARCGHDHRLTADSYFRRMVRLGVNLHRMYRKHGDPAVLWRPEDFRLDDAGLLLLQARCERLLPEAERIVERVRDFCAGAAGRSVSEAELQPLRALARDAGLVLVEAGYLLDASGTDVRSVVKDGPPKGAVTAVVIRPGATPEDAARTLASIARHEDPAHPTEVRVAAGVTGAERSASGGEWVAVLEAGVEVGAGWLERLLYHGEVDGKVGLVGALATHAAHGQRHTPSVPEVRRAHRYQRLLAGHVLLVRRRLLEEIGGLDPALAGTGLESADLALRSHLGGWRNRLALDVVVASRAAGEPTAEAWGPFAARWGLTDVQVGDFRSLVAGVERRPWRREELQPSPAQVPVLAAPAAPALRISLCVIARDEEACIGQAIASAIPWVDEAIVVDTGSADGTAQAARAAGARVVPFAWSNDFAAARNRGLDEATGDWVFWLDADETLKPGTGAALRALAGRAGTGLVGYDVAIDNRSDRTGREEVFRSFATRLFPRHPLVRWVRPVHEQVVHTADPGRLAYVTTDEVVLGHDGYLEATWQRKGKAARNAGLLAAAIQASPRDPANYYFLGQEHYGKGEFAAALRCLERALELAQGTAPGASYLAYVYALLAGACLETGRTRRGIEVGEEGARRFEYADLLCNLGGCLLAEGELERARLSFTRARALDGCKSRFAGEAASTTWRPLQGLGRVALAAGDAAQAFAHFEQALGLSPGRPSLLLGAARAALELGRPDEAEERYRRVQALRPDHEEANLGRVDCTIARGDVQAAYDRLTELVAEEPERLAYRIHLSDLLVEVGETDEAMKVLGQGMEREPKSALLYLKLGAILTRLERHEDALNAFTLAAAIEPGNVMASQAVETLRNALAARV